MLVNNLSLHENMGQYNEQIRNKAIAISAAKHAKANYKSTPTYTNCSKAIESDLQVKNNYLKKYF